MEDLTGSKMKSKMFKDLNTDEKILLVSSGYKVPGKADKLDVLKRIKSGEVKSEPVKNVYQAKTIRMTYWVAAAAAVALLLITVWFGFNNRETSVIAQRGTHQTITLPDGSVVNLNADSEIRFSKNNFNKNKSLEMNGEAFFSIQKGKRFTIKTKLADIQILGTSFNVFSRDNEFKVGCVTGKIKVTSGNELVIITPGESAEIVNGRLVKFTDNQINQSIRWRNGEFKMNNRMLKSVFKEIERQFNVKFVVSRIKDHNYSGTFYNNDLKETLDLVCGPMGLTYEVRKDSTVYIKEAD